MPSPKRSPIAIEPLQARILLSTLNVIASFNTSDGAAPMGDLVLSGGTLYGTTSAGGAFNVGDVFAVSAAGGTPTVLASFNGSSDGQTPVAGLILTDGTLYGTTEDSGAFGNGEVFALPDTGGRPPTLVASFNQTDGSQPQGDLLLSGGRLYGTAFSGGNVENNDGVVFSVPASGGTPADLALFNGTDGASPAAGLLLVGNTLYGTTTSGGVDDDGVVFSLPVTGGTPTVLASFNLTDGATPDSTLILSGNTLYGTTQGGGADGDGVVFSLPIAGGIPNILASFDGPDGNSPRAALLLNGNTLYGTTNAGGQFDAGEVFSLPTSGGTPTVLASFDVSNGKSPQSALILSGNTLYGTTAQGGPGTVGEVFSLAITPAGTPAAAQAAAFFPKLVTSSSPRTYFKFSIAFSDSVDLVESSIAGRPIYVTGPNGYGVAPNTVYARPTSLSPDVNSTSFAAGYRIYPPATDWTSADNGVYTIWLRKNRIDDVNGKFIPGQSLGTFTVDIPAAAQPAAIRNVPSNAPPSPFAMEPAITPKDESPDWLDDNMALFA